MTVYELTRSDVQELEVAVQHVITRRLDPAQLTRDQFLLGSLAVALATIDRSAGYCLIRGIPVERASLQETCIVLCGIGAQIGRLMPQDASGAVIHHVRAGGAAPTRGYQTSVGLPFHSDSCDTVGLLAIRTARSGGLSRVASARAVHDAIAATRPDLLRTLYEPFHIERHSGQAGYYSTPVFMRHAGRLFCRFNPGYVYSAQRHAETPRLTAQQEDAIDLFLELCESEAIRIDMELQPGDLQLLDNNTIVHSRTAYEDPPEIAKQRHLMRLWLFTSGLDDLPEPMRDRYREMESWRSRAHVPACD
jgi:TfdA family taurine catabolism dioxygenase TauD